MKRKFLEIILIAFMSVNIIPSFVYGEGNDEGNQIPEEEISETVPSDKKEETVPETAFTDGEGQQVDPDASQVTEEDKKEEPEKTEGFSLTRNSGNGSESQEGNDTEEDDDTVRTIMMYVCGSDLESYLGMATYNIKQILNSRFSNGNKVKFIVMLGGALEWFLEQEYLSDQNGNPIEKVSHTYNTIWEAKGADENGNHGKLVLLDGDGILGDGPTAKRNEPLYVYDERYEDYVEDTSIPYERMNDPVVLKSFINYCVENYPAEKYDIILWNHGGGPLGGFATDIYSGRDMPFAKLVYALSDNDLIKKENKKFDFIDFDACLMNSLEYNLALMDLTDYYLASPETIPGYGQQYTGWLNMLYDDPDINSFTLGMKLVDDFYDFYENGYGDGNRQEGTMAVIDMNKLKASGFVEHISTLFDMLSDEILTNLYYDELQSVLNSITYGGKKYYDLGNIISQISVAQKEIDIDNIGEGELNMDNRYLITAKAINEILNNREIIYNCCTHGIKTGEFVYRDPEGEIKYSDYTYSPIGSSGMYVYFVSPTSPREAIEYYDAMGNVIDEVSNSKVKGIFDKYRKAILDMSIVEYCGQAVGKMVNNGYQKEKLSYEDVKSFWKINPYDGEEGYDFSDWSNIIGPLFLLRNYGISDPKYDYSHGVVETDDFVKWMNKLIPQMATEAVSRNNIDVYEVIRPDGVDYEVRIKNTRKRVIDSVNYEIVAEIPLLTDYLEEEGLTWLSNAEMSIGSLSGTEKFDMDIYSDSDADSFVEDYIRWLNSDSATWEIDGSDNKWYAINDAENNNHVIVVVDDTDMQFTIATYKAEKEIEIETPDGTRKETVFEDEYIGIYFKNNGEISHIMMGDESGNYRAVRPQDLKKELIITPVLRIPFFVGELDIPISTPFTLSAENRDNVRIIYTDIDNIPDIEDTTGDGNKLTKRFVIRDIYNSSVDISKMIDNPAGTLRDIEFAEVEDAVYTGSVLDPVIMDGGNVLEEGKDYILVKADDEIAFKDADNYFVWLHGIGDYTGLKAGEFIVNPAQINVKNADTAEFTGKAQNPVFRIDGKILKEGKDYIINGTRSFTDVGVYKDIILEGIGNFTGTSTAVFEIIPAYPLISDKNPSWHSKDKNGLLLRFRRFEDNKGTDTAYNHFLNGGYVEVDGNRIDEDDYDFSEGSINITLKPAFLEKLSDGTHFMQVYFDDGHSHLISFRVIRNEYKPPVTGIE